MIFDILNDLKEIFTLKLFICLYCSLKQVFNIFFIVSFRGMVSFYIQQLISHSSFFFFLICDIKIKINLIFYPSRRVENGDENRKNS